MDMHNMFHYCPELTCLDQDFNTSNVTDMHEMFAGCSSLTMLDLDNFSTGNLLSLYWMFYGCNCLVILDIGSFDLSMVEYDGEMIDGCDSLRYFVSPKKTVRTTQLPVTMYDASGNEYSELPVISKSIILTKEKSGYMADISKCTITLSPDRYVYTGQACRPVVTVDSGNQALNQVLDRMLPYNIVYVNNVDA
jgi:surface protein